MGIGMSAVAHTDERPVSAGLPALDLRLPTAFARIAVRYLVTVLPATRRELAQWLTQAAQIPDANLRATALHALSKRGNVEGAALFATLAPASHRRRTIRALAAFQVAYNYLDALSELPSEDPVANGYQLHQALLVALQPGAPHPNYYAHNPDRDDGGYLTAILDACRHAIADLPSFPLVAPTVLDAAARIVDFQALNLGEAQGGHDALERWARDATPAAGGLAWWETAAGAGSSLAVHALIAAAADPQLDELDARRIDRAYHPSTGALHSLLDSLVDRLEDRDGGRRCLLDYYASPVEEASRLAELAAQAGDRIARLPNRCHHQAIVTAMCSYYLSAPECKTAEGQAIARDVTGVLGPLLTPALVLFRARRQVADFTCGGYC
jgi:tetraprenyl-beta-curcumene synthase